MLISLCWGQTAFKEIAEKRSFCHVLGEGFIMESQLSNFYYYPVQLNGWNKTFGKIPLMECYDKCFENQCQMLYHTNLKKCMIFEKLFLDYAELTKAPRKERQDNDIIFIYWLRPWLLDDTSES